MKSLKLLASGDCFLCRILEHIDGNMVIELLIYYHIALSMLIDLRIHHSVSSNILIELQI